MGSLGIELSPDACRIVELAGSRRAGRAKETRVNSFAILPPLSQASCDALKVFRGRRANVIVWTARDNHRQVVVTDGSYERMRAEARAAAREIGVQTRATLADIASAGPRIRGTGRRTVMLATADAGEVAAALGPLTEAGVKIGAVLTPAAALLSVASMRRSLATPGAYESYVALEETAGCAVLVRDGILLAVRNLAWGFVDEAGGARPLRSRDWIAARLADDLAEFVLACRREGSALTQISVCGALPDLRSMAAILVERIDVEVEPLDSLFGIDAAALSDHAEEFRERTAELRLAWAAAADTKSSIDFYRARRRRAVKTYLSRAAIAAGVAAGLGVGWMVQNTWRPVALRADRRAPSEPSRQVPSEPSRQARVIQPPPASEPPGSSATSNVRPPPPAPGSLPPATRALSAGARSQPAGPAPPAAALTRSGPMFPPLAALLPPVTAPPRAAGPPPAPRVGGPSPAAGVAGPPPRQTTAAPPSATPSPTTPAPSPTTPAPSATAVQPPPPRSAPAPPPLAQRGAAPRVERPVRAAEIASPFDAALATILYSADRRLAIVDGRIVEEGDEVRGARIVEITPTAVLLRDRQGRLRRLDAAGR